MKKALSFIFLAACVLLPLWSLTRSGMFHVHDYVHGARIIEYYRGVTAGHIPVRWSENFGYGYGMPLFQFYAPLPYAFGAVMYWLSKDLLVSVKSLFVVAQLVSVVGGYFLGKRLTNRRLGGLITAFVIAIAPYRALNLFIRGALSESWAMAFIPLMWYALVGLLQNNTVDQQGSDVKDVKHASKNQWFSIDWWLLTAASSGIILSHNLTTLMVFPVTGIALVLWMAGQFMFVHAGEQFLHKIATIAKQLCRPFSAWIATAGLTSFYLLPAFLEKETIRTDIFLEGYFNYRMHFLYIRQFFDPTWKYGGSTWGPDDDISFFVGWPILIAIIGFLAVLLIAMVRFLHTALRQRKQITASLKSEKTNRSQVANDAAIGFFRTVLHQLSSWLEQQPTIGWIIFFGFIAAISLFASIQKAAFAWEIIPLVENIQFPWRFLSLSSVAFAALTGLIVTFAGAIPSNSTSFFQRFKTALYQYIFAVVVLLAGFGHVTYFTPESQLGSPEAQYYEDHVRIQNHMSDIMLDYIPKTMRIDGTNASQNKTEIGESENNAAVAIYASTKPVVNDADFAELQSLVTDPHQTLVAVTNLSETSMLLEFPIAYFPGWQVTIDGEMTQAVMTDAGLLAVWVPTGQHQVGAYLSPTPVRQFADMTTLTTIIVLSCIVAYQSIVPATILNDNTKRKTTV